MILSLSQVVCELGNHLISPLTNPPKGEVILWEGMKDTKKGMIVNDLLGRHLRGKLIVSGVSSLSNV